MQRIWFVGVMVLMVAAVLGVASCSSAPRTLEKVTLRLDFQIYGIHAPLYLAADKGFYAEEGLEVDLQPSRGSAVTAQMIGSKTEQFGLMDLSILPKAVSEGVPIKAIGALLQKNATTLVFRKAEIGKPKDLEGKKIALPPGSSVAQIAPAFLKAQGVDVTKIQMLALGGGENTAAFLARRVEASTSFYNNNYPTLVAESDAELGHFFLADYGFNFIGTGFATNVDLLNERPDLVRRFLKASYRGFQYASTHRDEAIEALIRRNPELKPAIVKAQLDNSFQLIETGESKRLGYGAFSKAQWERSQDILVENKLLDKKVPNVEVWYTNEFVP